MEIANHFGTVTRRLLDRHAITVGISAIAVTCRDVRFSIAKDT